MNWTLTALLGSELFSTSMSSNQSSCPSIYDRTESTVSHSVAYVFSIFYIIGFTCSCMFDGTLAFLIIWVPELRRIRINFFVFLMALGNILSSLTITVTFANMTFNGMVDPAKENVMTRSYTFFNIFALYSLVAMCFEALRFLSLKAHTTVKHDIRRTSARCCARHRVSWLILIGVVGIALVPAVYTSFDQPILGSSGHIPTVLTKMTVFVVFHAYVPIMSMAAAVVIAVSFWKTKANEAPRFMEVVISERRRGVKLIMMVAVIHILFSLPHAVVASYYVYVLRNFPLDQYGCILNTSDASVLKQLGVRDFHRFSSLMYTISMNVNGILILVLSKRINKSLKVSFRKLMVGLRLRSEENNTLLSANISFLESDVHSVKNAFRIGELGGTTARISCATSPYQYI